MTITINATGAERKRLVKTISDWTGVPANYCGAPSFNYEVDYFTIDKNGSLSFDDRADTDVIERLLQHLYDEGFDIDRTVPDTVENGTISGEGNLVLKLYYKRKKYTSRLFIILKKVLPKIYLITFDVHLL